MINEIVKMVAKKANLSEPIARIAVDVVVSQLKGKLPPAVGGTVDALLSGGAKKPTTTQKANNPLGDLGNLAGTIGGLLGKK